MGLNQKLSQNRCRLRLCHSQTLELQLLTKRQILAQINGIYDPLGLLSPFVIKGKILLRELWARHGKIGWDYPISAPMYSKWIQFFTEFAE